MTTLLLPSYAANPRGAKEFYPKGNGTTWTGTCTWLALEAARAAIEGRTPSSAAMAAMATDALARGYCTASNGATRMSLLAAYAFDRLGYRSRLVKQVNYAITNGNEEMAIDWHADIKANAGKNIIILQVAHGGRLIDVVTEIRDEAAPGLAYHAFAIVGIGPNGYPSVDGDHPLADQRLQTYAYDLRGPDGAVVNSLRAAVPVGMLILDVTPAKVVAPTPPPVKPPTPTPAPIDPAVALRAKLAQIAQIATSA